MGLGLGVYDFGLLSQGLGRRIPEFIMSVAVATVSCSSAGLSANNVCVDSRLVIKFTASLPWRLEGAGSEIIKHGLADLERCTSTAFETLRFAYYAQVCRDSALSGKEATWQRFYH